MQNSNNNLIKSGQIASDIVSKIIPLIKPKFTPYDIEQKIVKLLQANNVKSAFKNYNRYPANSCISVNQTIVHGIPNKRKFQQGDLVGLDFGVIYNGWYSDCAVSVPILPISPALKQLIAKTHEALLAGINQAIPGNRVYNIARAIEQVALTNNYGIIKELTGHGLGKKIHLPPNIPNYYQASDDTVLKPGMIIAIEPMFSLKPDQGSKFAKIITAQDGWSIDIKNKSFGCHFEHTILVTKSGPKIITQPDNFSIIQQILNTNIS